MFFQIFEIVLIEADCPTVWKALTHPNIMEAWMGEPDIKIKIYTDWTVGGPISIMGSIHGVPFINSGKVMEFHPNRLLRYSHLSSLSELPEEPKSFTDLTFLLEPVGEKTRLTLRITNFPTTEIFKHLELYWRTTIRKTFKEFVQNSLVLNKRLQNDTAKPRN